MIHATTGAPISAARVTLRGGCFAQPEPVQPGHYRAWVREASLRANVSAIGFRPLLIPVELPPEAPEVTLELVPGLAAKLQLELRREGEEVVIETVDLVTAFGNLLVEPVGTGNTKPLVLDEVSVSSQWIEFELFHQGPVQVQFHVPGYHPSSIQAEATPGETTVVEVNLEGMP